MADAEGDRARVHSAPLDCSALTRWRDEQGSESQIGELNVSGERLSGGGGRRRGDAWHRRRGTPPTWHKQGSTMTKIE